MRRTCNCTQTAHTSKYQGVGVTPPSTNTNTPQHGTNTTRWTPSPSNGGYGRGSCRPPLTIQDHQLQTDHLGAVAEQDTLVVALVLGLSVVQPQCGAAAHRLLPVLREGHGGLQPADSGIPSAPCMALDAQGPAPRPIGRQRPDLQCAGGHCPHGWPCPLFRRGRPPADAIHSRPLRFSWGAHGGGARERGGGWTCRGTACDKVLGSRALCGRWFGGSSQLQDGISIRLPRCGGQGCGGIMCGDTWLWGQRCGGHGSGCAGGPRHSHHCPGARRGGGHGHRLLCHSCEHSVSWRSCHGSELGWGLSGRHYPRGVAAPSAHAARQPPPPPPHKHSRPGQGEAASGNKPAPLAEQRGQGQGWEICRAVQKRGPFPFQQSYFKQCRAMGGSAPVDGAVCEPRSPAPTLALTPSAHGHRCHPGEGLLSDAQCHLALELHPFSHLLPSHQQRGHDVKQLLISLRDIEVWLLQHLVPPVPGEDQPHERVCLPGRAAQSGGLPRLQGTGVCLQLQRVREG